MKENGSSLSGEKAEWEKICERRAGAGDGETETRIKEGVSRKLRSEKTDNEIRRSLAKMLFFFCFFFCNQHCSPLFLPFSDKVHTNTPNTLTYYTCIMRCQKKKKGGVARNISQKRMTGSFSRAKNRYPFGAAKFPKKALKPSVLACSQVSWRAPSIDFNLLHNREKRLESQTFYEILPYAELLYLYFSKSRVNWWNGEILSDKISVGHSMGQGKRNLRLLLRGHPKMITLTTSLLQKIRDKFFNPIEKISTRTSNTDFPSSWSYVLTQVYIQPFRVFCPNQ